MGTATMAAPTHDARTMNSNSKANRPDRVFIRWARSSG